MKHGQKAVCPRCGYELTRFFHHGIQHIVAFSCACLIFLWLSLQFPFLVFQLHGVEIELGLLDVLQSYANMEYGLVSLFLIVTALILPLSFLFCLLYVIISFSLPKLLPLTLFNLKLCSRILPWNMAEILLVAILISFIKVQDMAELHFGQSFFAYLLFINCFVAVLVYFDRYQLWQLLQLKRGQMNARNAH